MSIVLNDWYGNNVLLIVIMDVLITYAKKKECQMQHDVHLILQLTRVFAVWNRGNLTIILLIHIM